MFRVGFRPAGVLAFSWGLEPSAETKDIGRLSIGGGAASPFNVGSACWADMNSAARPSRTQVRSSDSALLEIPNTHSDGLHARAELTRFTRDGFVLDWTLSDRYRRQFAYLAFG